MSHDGNPSSPDAAPGRRFEGIRSRLLTPAARAFVDWASRTAGPPVILDRNRFEPFDLRPWLGDLSILQRDTAAGDYRFRLFGTHWALAIGTDLTGQPLSEWPATTEHAIRDCVHAVAARNAPAGARVPVAQSGGDQDGRPALYEHVLWPLRYGDEAGDAVLVLAVQVSNDIALSAHALPAAGNRKDWFGADDPAFFNLSRSMRRR